RSIPLEAPRGPIIDRDGKTIVDNRAATAVQLLTADLPKTWSARLNELRRLSKIINVPVTEMVAELKKRGGDPGIPVTVQESIHRAQYLYLKERERVFPGVELVPTYLRGYPYQSLAAQVLGNVGPISPAQYKLYRRKGYNLSDHVGQGGVEARYDAYLRGRDGLTQVARRRHRTADRQEDARAGRGPRRGGPSDARHEPAASCREGHPGRYRGRSRLRLRGLLGGERRRDRGARPPRRLDPRPRLEPDLPAGHLQRARPEEARAAVERPCRARGQLPRGRPRDRRALPGRLGLQAGDGARGARGAGGKARAAARVHRG